jgi:hypothetical protein
LCFSKASKSWLENAAGLGKHDMAVAPEHYRAARLGLPQLPLAAILGFAAFGVAGLVFLAYTTFSHGTAQHSAAASHDAPAYEARAVPFDTQPEDPAQRAASITRALTATPMQVQRAESVAPEGGASVSDRPLLAETDRELRGFHGFSNFAGANSFLAFTGTSFGMSAQNMPSGHAAPDAETFTAAPVPEASTWMCGGALLLLVAYRGARASWHRKRRRLNQ